MNVLLELHENHKQRVTRPIQISIALYAIIKTHTKGSFVNINIGSLKVEDEHYIL